MNEKLESIKKEYDEITQKLSTPEVTSDAQKYKKLSKKQNDLKTIVDKSEALSAVEKSIKDNEEIISGEKDNDLINMAKEENEILLAEKAKLEEAIKTLLIPKDPRDEKDVIVEIRAGAGGDEAGLFAADLFRMYAKYAEKQSWKSAILSSSKTTIGGFKEVIFEINGADVFSKMKYESGVHRVQRIPTTEKQGRIHTSTVTVAVLPEVEEKEMNIKNEDLRIDTFCSSGPGGQSVNTTYSAIRVTHLPTGLVVSCQDEKSQQKNKAKALQILRSRLQAIEEEKRMKEEKDMRKSQIGTGERSEKIRTYNFPQSRVTDHRIKVSWHDLENILNGHMDEIVGSLQKADREKKEQKL